MPRKLVILDVSSLLHRAYHALPHLSTRSGVPTNAVYGLAQMVLLLLEQEQPDFVAGAFDAPGPTFRHERYPKYKESRPPPPPDLVPQFALAKELLAAFGLTGLEVPGYEADDIMGALAQQAQAEGLEVLLVSGDRDLLQLVRPGVEALLTIKGVRETMRYDEAAVQEQLGLRPEQIPDAKGLAGDNSDDIPGIPGIGPKTAAALLQRFGSVEELLRRLPEVDNESLRQKLEAHRETALLSKELGKIVTDVPLSVSVGDLRVHPLDRRALTELLTRLEFTSLLSRLPGGGSEWEAQYQAIGTASDLRELARRISGPCGLAVELAADEPRGLALAPAEGEAYYVPADAIVQSRSGESGRLFAEAQSGVQLDADVRAALDELFAGDGFTPVGFDLKLQFRALKAWGLKLPRGKDPQLAAYLLDPDRSGLGAEQLVLERLGQELPALEPSEAAERLSPGGRRACCLADAALRLWPALEREVRHSGQWELYDELETPLAYILAEMEQAGIAVDRDRLAELGRQMGEQADALRKQIYELAGQSFNVDSPKQLSKVLFEDLGLPPGRKTKTGYSTNAEVLESLSEKHPIAARILEYRSFTKLKSTYVEALARLADPDTGRVHTTFEQTVAATGRLSSRDPNLQNIPIKTEWGREIRACFVPGEDDWELVSADYSQIELRILAHLSGDRALKEAFQAGADIHRQTAGKVFGVADDEVTPEMRRRAKTINFAIIYGMGSAALARELDISQPDAEQFIQNYFAVLPGVKRYIEDTVSRARQEGYVTTLMGRRRSIPGLTSTNNRVRSYSERAAVNTPIQGSAADIMKLAMVRVHDWLKSAQPAARMLLQVHDELVFEVAREQVPEVATRVREVMQNTYHLDVPLVVDVGAGENWRDLQPVC